MTYKKEPADHKAVSTSKITLFALVALLLFLLQPAAVQAQWTTNGNNINNTNSGNVGVNTTVPATELHVASEASGPRGVTSSQHSTDGNGAMYNLRKTRGTKASPAAAANGDSIGNLYAEGYDGASYISGGRIRFVIDGTVSAGVVPTSVQFFSGTGNFGGVERMRISSAGNVGIGTTTPSGKLDIMQSDGADLLVRAWNSATASGSAIFRAAASSNGNEAARLELTDNSGFNGGISGDHINGLIFRTGNQSTSYSAMVARMAITPAGNVGIGTTAPSNKLHVVTGTDNFTTPLSLDTGVHGGTVMGVYGTANNESGFDLSVYRSGQYQSRLGVNNFGAVYLQANTGSVGVGTSTPNSSYKLDVNGNTNITGNMNVTGNIAAKYQDVAEWVPSTQKLAAGTVVVLDQTKSNQVIASWQAYDTRVAGVISAQPGIALGEEGDSKVLVATTGRVKVKVDASAGSIQVGDLLVTSDVTGFAKKSKPLNFGGVQIHRPGTLIGKALEPLAKGTGEILVLLSLQ